MKLASFILASAAVTGLSLAAPPARGVATPSRTSHGPHNSHEGRTLQAFDAMYGVDGPFVGESFPIRDIPGDELPWVIHEARGRLDTDGHLTVRVKGLVFADVPEVPPELRGKNDETEFRAAVSCLSESEDETQVTTVNVITDGFPATTSGDSVIRTTVALPNPCVAPVIMVLAGSEDKWFAVAGFEAEED